jgi:hypothetical protein
LAGLSAFREEVMRRVAICVIALSLLPLSGAIVAARGDAKVKDVQVEKKKPKKEKSVPEPTLMLLLGGAAAVAGARKLWQNRG